MNPVEGSSHESLPDSRGPLALRQAEGLRRAVLEKLMQTRYFRQVAPQLLDAVLLDGQVVAAEAGEILIEQGSRDTDTMFFLLDGVIDIFADGKYILSLAEVGEAVGEIAAVTRMARMARVTAQTPCKLVRISLGAVLALRMEQPLRYVQFLELITRYLANKLGLTTQRVQGYEDMVLESARLRTHSEEMEKEVQRRLREIILYSHVMESSQDGILIADLHGRILAANPAVSGLYGWGDSPPDAATLQSVFPQLAKKTCGGALPREAFREEWRIAGTVQGEFPAEATFTTMLDGAQVVACALFLRDIRTQKELVASLEQSKAELARYSHHLEEIVAERTQALKQSNQELRVINERLHQETEEKDRTLQKLKEAQSQLVQTEKMASLGQLAAGMAHEINNPIGFVTSNLNTLWEYFEQISRLIRQYRQLEQGPDAHAEARRNHLAEIEGYEREIDLDFILGDGPALITDSLQGAARVAAIVRNLQEFTHLDQAEKIWADLNDGIESTINLCWNQLKYKAHIVKDFGTIPELECFPQLLNQAFLNLLMNAVQSIEKEGTITVRTALEGDSICVRIEDTGCGIAPEHLPRIFDPFFTTKPVGSGTGLGLTTVYQIVQSHRGTIDVQSEVGRGTRVTLRLPIRPHDGPLPEKAE